MGDIDWKGIGLGAKDVVVGIAGAVAGIYGGSGAATAVTNAGAGIDKIVGAAAPETHEAKTGGAMAEKKPNQAEKFDRADFTPTKKKPVQRAPANVKPAAQSGKAPAAELLATVDYLRQRGWSMSKIRMILAGPDQNSIHAVTGQDAAGTKVRGAPAEVVPEVTGVALALAKGQRVSTSSGRRVSVDKPKPKATESAKQPKTPTAAVEKDGKASAKSESAGDNDKPGEASEDAKSEEAAEEAATDEPDVAPAQTADSYAEGSVDSEAADSDVADPGGDSDVDAGEDGASDEGSDDSSDADSGGESSSDGESMSEA